MSVRKTVHKRKPKPKKRASRVHRGPHGYVATPAQLRALKKARQAKVAMGLAKRVG